MAGKGCIVGLVEPKSKQIPRPEQLSGQRAARTMPVAPRPWPEELGAEEASGHKPEADSWASIVTRAHDIGVARRMSPS